MIGTATSLRVGIHGPEEREEQEVRGCSLWATGYGAAITAAGATAVHVAEHGRSRSWREVLEDVQAVVWTGRIRAGAGPTASEERLCAWCRKNRLPLLAVDNALHALNVIHGGTLHLDLCRERPEALQHRHPPEKGLRHAIAVVPGTHLADMYGDGEIVVNSEHRAGIDRVGRGFRVSAHALDGIIEAIEFESEGWFALGVQWRPGSASASGLDIQLFRGLLQAAEERVLTTGKRTRAVCTSAA